ncbi:MAG: hypothetical protein JXR25_04040 [Pontiellaceae bacterium]|nr:hypothetical protein [Pontiellaceae bacterium]MBN2783973.1 hypothetical protein [Pontiellaceae bacterium]
MNNDISMVISVMDCDRPGIVAEITTGIEALGGNLADLSQTVLCGYFTMILVADFPAGTVAGEIENSLAGNSPAHVFVVEGRGLKPEIKGNLDAYVLSAHGKNRAGLVAQVSRFCFNKGINILDLTSHAAEGQYTMMLQLDLSDIGSIELLGKELEVFGKENGLTMVLQHNDIFRATNEI